MRTLIKGNVINTICYFYDTMRVILHSALFIILSVFLFSCEKRIEKKCAKDLEGTYYAYGAFQSASAINGYSESVNDSNLIVIKNSSSYSIDVSINGSQFTSLQYDFEKEISDCFYYLNATGTKFSTTGSHSWTYCDYSNGIITIKTSSGGMLGYGQATYTIVNFK